MGLADHKYTVFYDRHWRSVEGFLSVVRDDGVYIFNKLRARSGQAGYTDTSWEVGKSPCPRGRFKLSTNPNNRGQRAGRAGIGECFPMSTNGDRYLIVSLNRRKRRTEICIHEENDYVGSAGCIVIVNEAEWLALRDWLRSLYAAGITDIEIEVL